MDSEQKRRQYGSRTNRQQHGRHRYQVGERKVYEEKKNFAGKDSKIAKVIVRIETFEGLQPMAIEASSFMRGIEINKWTFAMWMQYKHFQQWVNVAELRMVEIEYMTDQKEEDDHRLDDLTSYTRRIHCGLIVNGLQL